MKYHEAIKYVQESNAAVYALLEKTEELFVIIYEKDPELFSDTIIWYVGERIGEESFDPEEFYLEFEDQIDQLKFVPSKKDVIAMKEYHFDHVLEEISNYNLV